MCSLLDAAMAASIVGMVAIGVSAAMAFKSINLVPRINCWASDRDPVAFGRSAMVTD